MRRVFDCQPIRQKLEKLRDQAAAEQARAVPEPAKESTAAVNSSPPASSGATPPGFTASNSSPAPNATPSPTFRSPAPSNFGGGGGGGAIDPLSAAIAAGLAGAAWAAS